MLQEMPEEPNRDDITGVPLEDDQAREDVDQIVRVLKQGEAFHEMTKTQGWKLLCEFIEGQVNSLICVLKVEKDFDKIVRIQSELLAFESLPLIVEKSFIDHEEASRRVKDFINGDPKG